MRPGARRGRWPTRGWGQLPSALLLALGACRAPAELEAPEAHVRLETDGRVRVERARLDLTRDRDRGLLRAWLERWRRAEAEGRELLVWVAPQASGGVLVELLAEVDAAGIDAYRVMRRGERE